MNWRQARPPALLRWAYAAAALATFFFGVALPASPPGPRAQSDAPTVTDPLPEARPEAQGHTLPLSCGGSLAFHPILVTGYSSCPSEADSTPHETASMTTARSGSLALSRDLLSTFTPGAPFDFGDRVVLPGVGIFVVEDTMHPRWRSRADIWFPDRRQAVRWGRRRSLIARLPHRPRHEAGLLALGPVAWEPR